MDDHTPREEELTDPAVRQLLWRLRARLVTPPDADRTTRDLEQLFAAAREHAHEAPDEASPQRREPQPVRLEPVAELRDRATRRGLPAQALSRVAAAIVLLAAVGGGVAGARDGQLSLQALLGTAPAVDQEPSEDLAAPAPVVEEDGSQPGVDDPPSLPDLDAADPGDGVPDVQPPDTEVAPAPQEPAPDAGNDAGSGSAEPTPDTGSSTPPAGSGESSSNGNAGGSSSNPPADPAPEPEPETEAEPEPVDPGQEDVIAAPPARDLDGFGGPQPCPEGQDLSSCLEDRATDGDDPATEDDDGTDEASGDDGASGTDGSSDADASSGSDGSSNTDGSTEQDGTSSQKDELARRRGAG